jgi:hypothetical protein
MYVATVERPADFQRKPAAGIRAHEPACYRPTVKPAATFRIGTQYQCSVHAVQCVAPMRGRPCNAWTLLRPLCRHHARDALGVVVGETRFPSGAVGTGLYAAREFRKGDLICPYLGARRPDDEWICPRSTGTGDVTDSGYTIRVTAPDGEPFQYDASCERSYGSMVNHECSPGGDERTARSVGIRGPMPDSLV